MAHKITVNDTCIGCGACSATCPETFAMKDGKAYPIRPEVEEITCEKTAEAGCPVDAIKVT
jgi:ferredoxin